ELPRAKGILASVAQRMPSARDLWFAYRVLSRCVSVGSRAESGFQLHMARGLVTYQFRQYSLDDILRVAEDPGSTAVGRYFSRHLSTMIPPGPPGTFVVNLRNDGELNQAVIIAAILKGQVPGSVGILDASGANEQFDFGGWAAQFEAKSGRLGRFL